MHVLYSVFFAIGIGSWNIYNENFEVSMNILKMIDLLIALQGKT